MLASIPRAMLPHLRGMRVSGTLSFSLDLDVDLADPYGLQLALDGTLDTCRVLTLGRRIRIERLLRDDFVHQPIVDGEPAGLPVGPGTRWWVPLERIPSHVAMAAIATEDLAFFEHQGFRLSLIRRALKMDLDRGRYVYGGSTISQQLVKNLFLTRDKNLARKLEEAILTWQMERIVPKRRILALYLNCIEYGPGIWGIRQAALHYFGKEPEALTPLEGAFLMGNKPCPKCGWWQWRRGRVNARWRDRLAFILDRLRRRGWITEAQFEAARPFTPPFRPVDAPLPPPLVQ